MIILPVRSRRKNILRFIQDCEHTKVTEKICVIIDADDVHNYLEIDFPANFEVDVVSPSYGVQQKLNFAFLKYYNEDYYAFIGDDLVPLTEEWDQLLRDEVNRPKNLIVYGDDGIQAGELCTHPWVRGSLVRRIGWFCCPRIQHWYFDNVWKDIGEKFNAIKYIPEIKFDHQHPFKYPEKKDETYHRQPDPQMDRIHYEYWRYYEFPQLIERIKV